MATGLYAGVNDVSKKILKSYVGVNGQAKNIKKVYVGVNGQAKLAYQDKIVKDVFKVIGGANSGKDLIRGITGSSGKMSFSDSEIYVSGTGTTLATKWYDLNFYTAADSSLNGATMYVEFVAYTDAWKSESFQLNWDGFILHLNRYMSSPNERLIEWGASPYGTFQGTAILNNKAYGTPHTILYEIPTTAGKLSGTIKIYVDGALYASTTMFAGRTAPRPFGAGNNITATLYMTSQNHLRSIRIWGEV